jgi:hypothetical protein
LVGHEEAQGSLAIAGDVPSSGTDPIAGGGTPEKPRSGFQRQKIKIQRLTELYENALGDYERLLADHDRLEQNCRSLEAAFDEIEKLNASLADELRKIKQQRPAPVRYGTLMGT